MASRSREVHENRMASYGLPLSEPYDTEVVEVVEAALDLVSACGGAEVADWQEPNPTERTER